MISSVVLTKNEEKNIKDCLDSLRWCDEIVVIDDFSEDKTTEIAKKYGARISKRALDNDFASQRNFGLEKAKGDWVLFVDADERVSQSLQEEILKLLGQNTSYIGFYLHRRDFMWGKELKHGEPGSVRLLRLAKRDSGKWERRVHEVWDVKGRVGELKNPLIHHPHPTLREFMAEVDWMSTLHAQENRREGKKSNLFKIVLLPKMKFLNNWILKRGFLDGTPGFLVAMVMAFHSFLSWSKLWLLQRK